MRFDRNPQDVHCQASDDPIQCVCAKLFTSRRAVAAMTSFPLRRNAPNG
jgi:hypothetical protein